MYHRFESREPAGPERPVRGRGQLSQREAEAARIESLILTRLVLAETVEVECRALVVAPDGEERSVDAVVELPDGARAMLLSATWSRDRNIVEAVRDVGLGCARRLGAERLLAAGGDWVALRASIDDIRAVLAERR